MDALQEHPSDFWRHSTGVAINLPNHQPIIGRQAAVFIGDDFEASESPDDNHTRASAVPLREPLVALGGRRDMVSE